MAADISGLAEGIAALVELVFKTLVRLISGTVTLVAYLCSKKFRARKQAEWAGSRFKKYASLTYSGICVIGLLSLCSWMLWYGMQEKKRVPATDVAGGSIHVELRSKEQPERNVTVAVKPGGVSKILATTNLAGLKHHLKENVTITTSRQTSNSVADVNPSATLDNTASGKR